MPIISDYDGNTLISILIPAKYEPKDINFVSKPEHSQQVAIMHRPKDYTIQNHYHNKVHREVQDTLEVIFVKFGKVKVDLFGTGMDYIASHILTSGDTIFLITGGHGFTFLEPSTLIEVKQGPYAGSKDKTRF